MPGTGEGFLKNQNGLVDRDCDKVSESQEAF